MVFISNNEYLLNKDIKSEEVRIVGGELMSKEKALEIAENNMADLIEVSRNKGISICVIESFDKFLYNKKKLEKNKNKGTQKSSLKEVKLGLSIGENDLLHKAKKTEDFIKNGYKVKVSILLKGREISRNKDAVEIIDKFIKLCGVAYEQKPKLEGSNVFAIVTRQK